ncbi:MAG: hypothetical protein WD851_23405 [Pirellulales bacterium]
MSSLSSKLRWCSVAVVLVAVALLVLQRTTYGQKEEVEAATSKMHWGHVVTVHTLERPENKAFFVLLKPLILRFAPTLPISGEMHHKKIVRIAQITGKLVFHIFQVPCMPAL